MVDKLCTLPFTHTGWHGIFIIQNHLNDIELTINYVLQKVLHRKFYTVHVHGSSICCKERFRSTILYGKTAMQTNYLHSRIIFCIAICEFCIVNLKMLKITVCSVYMYRLYYRLVRHMHTMSTLYQKLSQR